MNNIPSVPFGASNHQHALDLVTLLTANLKWYQAVKCTYHPNGQFATIEIGWDRGAAWVAGIATAGVILIFMANPVLLTSFGQLVQFCITQLGKKAVISKIGEAAVVAAGVPV